MDFYKRSAGQNFANAQFNLGQCYAKGIGVAKDRTLAKQYYQAAADQGHVKAKEKLKSMWSWFK